MNKKIVENEVLGIKEEDNNFHTITNKPKKRRRMTDFYIQYDSLRISKSKRLQYKLKNLNEKEKEDEDEK